MHLTRSSTLGSLPLAITVVTPDWAASQAEATLASMPPRPTLLPLLKRKLSRILGMNVCITLHAPAAKVRAWLHAGSHIIGMEQGRHDIPQHCSPQSIGTALATCSLWTSLQPLLRHESLMESLDDCGDAGVSGGWRLTWNSCPWEGHP